ncbi:hypothetical protein N7468_010202 [Penicillium chermesinum]|uniref:Uncharacterized protein n=1 Tax=Penicillium chermesinum TaxID=63820 RepID=A0A9W9NE03_9EURO|nr:uncharacterized protein N7468_010202 [Penicillium chermesinum]KAJ5217194.1 hypothetical protein N7468_010202 [Penicillium chermesinum]KAJ6171191.1 hypothetical protein N7470_000258 [Penicillium chermesinum]
MAAPADATIKNLNGKWVMDSTLSDPSDSILALQGMSWFLRKALPYATVTLYVKEYPDSSDPKVYHIDVDQVITGGITGTKEARTLDWQERDHKDAIFGTVKGRSRFLRARKEDGVARPAVEFCTKAGGEEDARLQKFLRGETLIDGSASQGFEIDAVGDEFGEGEGLFLQNFVDNEESKWTAEQIWGFEIINGERRHTRRVAVTKNGKVEIARLVYSYEGPVE